MDGRVFANKICVVTGAASGLGLEFSKQLAAAGAQVVMADID
jgi:NAD(P)-dependent dehydrogenase (short-subunit alcohol dehydrogenase family)